MSLVKSALPGVLVALIVIVAAMAVGIPSAQSQIPTNPPTEGEATTSRIAGEDRFDTSAQISQRAFPTGAPVAYLARADEPADALSGGSLTDGPILLVRSCGTLPDVIADELGRLNPAEVIALGGEDAICDEVLQAAGEAANADAEPTPAPSATATPTPSPGPTETESEGFPIPTEFPSGDPTPTPTPTPTTAAAS